MFRWCLVDETGSVDEKCSVDGMSPVNETVSVDETGSVDATDFVNDLRSCREPRARRKCSCSTRPAASC
eukprot:1923651-Pleurochrysis_carterae.AAC.3